MVVENLTAPELMTDIITDLMLTNGNGAMGLESIE
jgi:hypothetical protein